MKLIKKCANYTLFPNSNPGIFELLKSVLRMLKCLHQTVSLRITFLF